LVVAGRVQRLPVRAERQRGHGRGRPAGVEDRQRVRVADRGRALGERDRSCRPNEQYPDDDRTHGHNDLDWDDVAALAGIPAPLPFGFDLPSAASVTAGAVLDTAFRRGATRTRVGNALHGVTPDRRIKTSRPIPDRTEWSDRFGTPGRI